MTATDDAPAVGVDEKLSEWRQTKLADVEFKNSVVRMALDKAKFSTLGEVEETLRGGTAGEPPLNLTEHQIGYLEELIDHHAAGDPAYTPFFDPAAVHRTHCCQRHGCKYGDDDCPVADGKATGLSVSECEHCQDEGLDDPTSPAALAEYDQETARLVTEMNYKLLTLEIDWEHKHGEAAIAKKEFETARDKMLVFIRERADNRGKKDLFTGIPLHDADPAKPDPLADLWQQFPIEHDRWAAWGLTAKDCEKLNAGETKNHGTHPMTMLGDVQRFITQNAANPAYARTLKDVRGFGDKGFDRWTEAETKFWAFWNSGGKEAFAAEQGIAHADQPGAGAGTDSSGGDGDVQTGTLPGLEAAAEDRNPLPDATAEPKKRKGKGRAA